MLNKSDIIPFFPLGVFLLPGEDIPLRIFEPRYKQLIEDVRNLGITFVIPFVIESEIQAYGCEVKLVDVVAENPKGRMVITVESVSVIRIVSFSSQLTGKLYAGGTIRRLPDPECIKNPDLLRIIQKYRDQFDAEFLDCSELSHISQYDVMIALNLPSEDKYRFICMSASDHRESYLSGQLRYLNMIRYQESLLGNDFGLN